MLPKADMKLAKYIFRALLILVLTADSSIGQRLGRNARSDNPLVIGTLKVTRENHSVVIPAVAATFKIGASCPLFQHTERHFIIGIEGEGGQIDLAAVPVRTLSGPTAWIGDQNEIIFASKTTSCKGKFYLDIGEELQVMEEDDNCYIALATRHGRKATLRIPKKRGAFEFTRFTQPMRLKTEATPIHIFKVGAIPGEDENERELADGSVFDRLHAMLMNLQSPAPDGDEPKGEGPANAVEVEYVFKPVVAVHDPSASMVAVPPVYLESPPAIRRLPWYQGWGDVIVSFLSENRRIYMIQFAILVLIAGLFMMSVRKTCQSIEPELEKVSSSSAGFKDQDDVVSPSPVVADFCGSIESMTPASLSQILNSERESGALTFLDEKDEQIGSMVFLNGEIIDARSPGRRGVKAVQFILRQKKGSFFFIRQDASRHENTVQQSTLSLLLNACRVMDEEQSSGLSPV